MSLASPAARRRWHSTSFPALALAAIVPLAAASEAPPAAMAELLQQSDVAEQQPASFRARILLQGPGEARVEIEVWREGPSRTLVRFLGATHRGKYLLYLEGGVFFLAPGARAPVKLPPSFRLHGSATLDHVLGLRYSRDYEVALAALSEDGAYVVFELTARDAKAQYPLVRYVVARAARRPTRAELRLKGGKLATSVEFVAWAPNVPLRPQILLVRDHLRGGAETRVELLGLSERKPPEGLFSLSDGTARRRLEEQEPVNGP